MSSTKMPQDKTFNRIMYRVAIATSTAFNAIIGRPKVYFESEKAEFKNLPSRLIIICNHTYWLDPANLSILFRQRLVNPVAAKEVFENGRGPLMRGLRCIPLDRSTMDIACIKECVNRLKDDQRVIIFPEGQLNLTDEILEFKAGAALIAMQAQSAVVPVYTSGVYRPFGGLKIMIGNPISYNELFPESLGATAMVNATTLMQKRMEALKESLMEKLSDKDKESRLKSRQKFAEKRTKATEKKQTDKGD